MNKNRKKQLIYKSLLRSIAELQNHLENTKVKIERNKKNKDFLNVVTYRNMKRAIEKEIKEYLEILKEYENR